MRIADSFQNRALHMQLEGSLHSDLCTNFISSCTGVMKSATFLLVSYFQSKNSLRNLMPGARARHTGDFEDDSTCQLDGTAFANN